MFGMEHREFKINSKYKPSGDQPKAIEQLVEGINKGYDTQTLLGITGSGKLLQLQMLLKKFKTNTYNSTQQNSCGSIIQ